VREYDVQVGHKHDRVYTIVRYATQPRPETLLQFALAFRARGRPLKKPITRIPELIKYRVTSLLACNGLCLISGGSYLPLRFLIVSRESISLHFQNLLEKVPIFKGANLQVQRF
jgi:hypothetical protein